jgi:NADPH2:quinone reductase
VSQFHAFGNTFRATLHKKQGIGESQACGQSSATVKAIQIQSHGGPEVLKLMDLPEPQATAGQVLVRVKASAVNPLDGIVRAGYFPVAAKPPLILGEEAAGIVERDGAQFKKGERVIVYGGGLGVFGNGTWAELVAVPNSSVRRLPEGVSFEEGAALANVGVTAYGALRHGALKAGESLLVLGATGGVGSAGVQIGKALGARVIAVVSKPEKAAGIAELGADHIVALSSDSLAEQVQALTGGKGADLVLDPIGGETTGKALAAVSTFGRLVHLGYSAGMTLTINSLDFVAKDSSILGFNIFLVPTERAAKDLDEVVALAAQGKYRALVSKTFPAAEVVGATAHLDQRNAAGKVVLTF